MQDTQCQIMALAFNWKFSILFEGFILCTHVRAARLGELSFRIATSQGHHFAVIISQSHHFANLFCSVCWRAETMSFWGFRVQSSGFRVQGSGFRVHHVLEGALLHPFVARHCSINDKWQLNEIISMLFINKQKMNIWITDNNDQMNVKWPGWCRRAELCQCLSLPWLGIVLIELMISQTKKEYDDK